MGTEAEELVVWVIVIVGLVAAPVGSIATTVPAGSGAVGTLPSIMTGTPVVSVAVTEAAPLSMSSFVTSGPVGEWSCLKFSKCKKEGGGPNVLIRRAGAAIKALVSMTVTAASGSGVSVTLV